MASRGSRSTSTKSAVGSSWLSRSRAVCWSLRTLERLLTLATGAVAARMLGDKSLVSTSRKLTLLVARLPLVLAPSRVDDSTAGFALPDLRHSVQVVGTKIPHPHRDIALLRWPAPRVRNVTDRLIGA